MKVIMALFITVAMFNPCTAVGSGARPKSKPQAPIKIEIITANSNMNIGNITGGDIVDLQILVSSYADIVNAVVNISLSRQLVLISGNVIWEGPLKKDDTKLIPITVQIPQIKGGKIKAKVVAPFSEGTSFSSSAQLSFNGVKKKPDKSPMKKDGKGRDIIEHRL